MNLKTWLPLGLAIVLGLVAALFARDLVRKSARPPAVASNVVEVVVARQPIAAGELLTEANCQIGRVGADSVPDGSYRAVADIGVRVAQVPLGRGQAVTDNLLAPAGSGVGLQAVIPPGMRAISIEVNEFSGVGGLLVPGCRVDVLATVPGDAASGGDMTSRTVVQNVTVTAVGQRTDAQPTLKDGEATQSFRSVTLIVTPAEAEAVELAAVTSRPRLVLRNGRDNATGPTRGVSIANLRGSSGARATAVPVVVTTAPTAGTAAVAVPAFDIVKVIRGTVESEVRFETAEPGPVSAAGAGANTRNAVSNGDTTPAAGAR